MPGIPRRGPKPSWLVCVTITYCCIASRIKTLCICALWIVDLMIVTLGNVYMPTGRCRVMSHKLLITFAKDIVRSLLFVCHSVICSVCMQDYCKISQPISVKLGLALPVPRTDWLFVVLDMDSESLFHFPRRFGIGDLLAFLLQSPADFDETRQNDLRWQGNESTTFWKRSGKHPDLNPA